MFFYTVLHPNMPQVKTHISIRNHVGMERADKGSQKTTKART